MINLLVVMTYAQESSSALLPSTELIGTGGSVALLGAVVMMIFTGRLVPRSALLDAQAERDKWAEVARAAIAQNNQLLTATRVTSDVLRALPDLNETS